MRDRPFIVAARDGLLSLIVLDTSDLLRETPIFLIPGQSIEMDIMGLRELDAGAAVSIFKRKNS